MTGVAQSDALRSRSGGGGGQDHPGVLADTWLVFTRALRLSLRNPVWAIVALVQPILYLALFGPLLTPLVSYPGFPPGDEWQIFVPALLVQLGLFGAAFVGFGLIGELRNGVVERMRVTPISRLALLGGRVLRDVLVLTVQAIILVVVAIPFGLRVPVGAALAGIALVAFLGVAFSSASYVVALMVQSEDSLASILNSVTLPLLLLSGILLPMSLAPRWLYWLSRINPLSYVVDGSRALFRGDYTSGTTAIAIAVAVALAVLSLTWGVRTFQRMSS